MKNYYQALLLSVILILASAATGYDIGRHRKKGTTQDVTTQKTNVSINEICTDSDPINLSESDSFVVKTCTEVTLNHHSPYDGLEYRHLDDSGSPYVYTNLTDK